MWQNTSESDGSADESVQFLVTSNGELEMAWRDALDLQILGSVACELQNFGSQVFENSSQVYAGFGADARLLSRKVSKMALYATAGELQ
jgi:hypothetical protein